MGVNGTGGSLPPTTPPTGMTTGTTGSPDTTTLGQAMQTVTNAVSEAMITAAQTVSDAVTGVGEALVEYTSNYLSGAYGPTPLSGSAQEHASPTGANRAVRMSTIEGNDPIRPNNTVSGNPSDGFIPGLSQEGSVGVTTFLALLGVGGLVLLGLCCYKSCSGDGARSRGTPEHRGPDRGRDNEGYDEDIEAGRRGSDSSSSSSVHEPELIDVRGGHMVTVDLESSDDEDRVRTVMEGGNDRVHWTKTTERTTRVIKAGKSGVGNGAYESDSDDERPGPSRDARPKPLKGGPKKPAPKTPPPKPPVLTSSDSGSEGDLETVDYGVLRFKRRDYD